MRHELDLMDAEIERTRSNLCGGAHPTPGTMRRFLTFMEGEMQRHVDSEEHSLYPCFRAKMEGNPHVLRQLMLDHQQLRLLVQKLHVEVSQLASLGDQQRHAVARCAADIVELLRAHLVREEEILFPLLEELLGPTGMADLTRRSAMGASQRAVH